jgi:uncharacterized membrane protein (DUF2068 family)
MSRTVRAIAALEALKGVLALMAAGGLLSLLHRDLHALALALVEHAHLNPAARVPRIFLRAAANLHDTRLVLLALGAAAYAAMRLVEALGLYRGRAWAEVLAAASGAVYLPFEAVALAREPSLLHLGLLLLNAAVVAVMLRALWRRRARRQRRSAAA